MYPVVFCSLFHTLSQPSKLIYCLLTVKGQIQWALLQLTEFTLSSPVFHCCHSVQRTLHKWECFSRAETWRWKWRILRYGHCWFRQTSQATFQRTCVYSHQHYTWVLQNMSLPWCKTYFNQFTQNSFSKHMFHKLFENSLTMWISKFSAPKSTLIPFSTNFMKCPCWKHIFYTLIQSVHYQVFWSFPIWYIMNDLLL